MTVFWRCSFFPGLATLMANVTMKPSSPNKRQATIAAAVLKLRSARDKGRSSSLRVRSGIHAAAWTSQVVSQIEASFAADPTLKSRSIFHDHLLLASGVSAVASADALPARICTDGSRASTTLLYLNSRRQPLPCLFKNGYFGLSI